MRLPPQTEEQRAKSDELRSLVKRSIDRFNAMSPEEQRTVREAQRKSWVIGEFMLSNPDATREYAEAIYDKIR